MNYETNGDWLDAFSLRVIVGKVKWLAAALNLAEPVVGLNHGKNNRKNYCQTQNDFEDWVHLLHRNDGAVIGITSFYKKEKFFGGFGSLFNDGF